MANERTQDRDSQNHKDRRQSPQEEFNSKFDEWRKSRSSEGGTGSQRSTGSCGSTASGSSSGRKSGSTSSTS